MHRLIVPNFHVILIHYPLGLFVLGVLIEVFSFLGWRASSFRTAGRWMILIGALSMLPAATTGIYAFYDVAGHGQMSQSWAQTKAASNFSTTDWDLVRDHIFFNVAGGALALIAVIMWLGGSDRWRRGVYYPAMAALIIAVGLNVVGAWVGGEMVYRHGFGVDSGLSVDAQVNPPGTTPTLEDKIYAYTAPTQLHLFSAGLVFAVSLAAIALSFRRATMQDNLLLERTPVVIEARPAVNPALRPNEQPPISLLQALDDPAVIGTIPPHTPAARFWLLGMVLAILTIIGGLWIGGFLVWPRVLDVPGLKDALTKIQVPGQRRMAMHIVFGASILILTIVLAMLAAWAPRYRIFLGFFSLLLLIAIAAQIWLGILLLYDSDTGPLEHFKVEAVAPSQAEAASTTQPSMLMPSP